MDILREEGALAYRRRSVGFCKRAQAIRRDARDTVATGNGIVQSKRWGQGKGRRG